MKNISPVTVDFLRKLPRINDVRFAPDGKDLVWSESVGKQGILYAGGFNESPYKLSDGRNLRGGLGYGGGDFNVGHTQVVFTDASGSIYTCPYKKSNSPISITPAWPYVAAPAFSPDGKWLLYCYSNNEIDGIAVVSTQGSIWPTQLVNGADFYMHPTWHPDGELIAWTEWDHPNMPWDASRVRMAEIGGTPLQVVKEKLIAGGAEQAASQPLFSPDGMWLSYIIRKGDWDDLVLLNLEENTSKIVLHGEGFHLREPDWIQGMRSYAWNFNSSSLVHFRYAYGKTTLWEVAVTDGATHQIDIHPVEWAVQLDVSDKDDGIIFLGSAPQIPKAICRIKDKKIEIRRSSAELKAGCYCSEPLEITFSLEEGGKGYGFYYPPLPEYSKNKAPLPLILHVHGGPTSAFTRSFNNEAAYFLSRGFGYAQVNYRGSSGYGYAYQDALRHQWGVVDVEDTILFAQTLIEQGYADANRMAVMGSSAGGFTVLLTLASKPGLFRAGICSYGVSDLLEDALNTHKFEKFYHQFLVGDVKKDKQRFITRSPIFRVDEIKDPVALFHGEEDKVVSLNQTLAIHQKLIQNGIPCELKVYPGEGHGFRKPETLADYYERIVVFLNRFL